MVVLLALFAAKSHPTGRVTKTYDSVRHPSHHQPPFLNHAAMYSFAAALDRPHVPGAVPVAVWEAAEKRSLDWFVQTPRRPKRKHKARLRVSGFARPTVETSSISLH